MRQTFIAALALAALGGCTVQQTDPPPLAGPSEFALSIGVQATPDQVTQDGVSQSAIVIDARGPDGRPVRALALSVDIVAPDPASGNPAVFDFGRLGSKTLVTGDDGQARTTYTAPPRSSTVADGAGTTITIRVVPIGNDYRGETARTVDVRLVPPGIITAPNSPPEPQFQVSPIPVNVFQVVTFDASYTLDEGVPCGTNCTYEWSFGDGTFGSGIRVQHEYRVAGTYRVLLTATDASGRSATLEKTATINQTQAPQASFVFSPASPAVSQDIFFSAEASRAAEGRNLIFYDWNFGSGRTGAGVTVAKRYDTPGTYVVTLTVTDDANQVGTVSQAITVGGQGTGITPALSFSPTNPTVGRVIVFDASASTGPSPIVEYRFSFGDTTADIVGSSPTTQHAFGAAGTYVVRVTMRDSAGRTGTTTVTVTVS